MDNSIPLLTVLGVLPLIFSLIAFAVRGRAGKHVAFVGSLVTMVFGIWIFFAAASNDFSEMVPWIKAIGAWYALSLDGMGRAMVLLSVILVPIVLIAEWTLDSKQTDGHLEPRWGSNVFGALALMVEGFGLFVFMASDVLLFYIFFEATLIPMFFLITGWGGAKRGKAAMKFLLYSLAGGLIMLF
ncbi:MAG: NADH-quinone oxidoreductase subunit M, partial [Propionibacterium sp.]|nr:NADH-quinone oxidoreductase subunit M [Propionibacterium sp.]